MKKIIFLFGILSVGSLLITSPNASEYWSSTFDNDSEGWQVYLYPENDFVQPTYNNNGYICYSKTQPYNWLFLKLNWYDWSDLYGGIISFDIKVSGDGIYNETGTTVVLDLPGEIGTYFYTDIPIKPPKDKWTTYRVPILDEVFKRYGSSESLSDFLPYIRGLDIKGNLLEGIETACIDNVKIYKKEIVDIDIKPGSYPNCFNINGNGIIPVAIFGIENHDVANIDIQTLQFNGMKVQVRGKKGKTLCHFEDVSGDFTKPEGLPNGYIDLVCQFEDDPELWVVGVTEAKVTGSFFDGTPIEGRDLICIIP